MPLSTIFQLHHDNQFLLNIGGVNGSIQWKPPTCNCQLLKINITLSCNSDAMPVMVFTLPWELISNHNFTGDCHW